jgi:hypothetical protein
LIKVFGAGFYDVKFASIPEVIASGKEVVTLSYRFQENPDSF